MYSRNADRNSLNPFNFVVGNSASQHNGQTGLSPLACINNTHCSHPTMELQQFANSTGGCITTWQIQHLAKSIIWSLRQFGNRIDFKVLNSCFISWTPSLISFLNLLVPRGVNSSSLLLTCSQGSRYVCFTAFNFRLGTFQNACPTMIK